MSTTIKRIKSPTPAYFIKIRWWATLIATVFTAITGFFAGYPDVIPKWLTITIGAITVACWAVSGFTFLPTTDKSLQDPS